MRGSIMQLRNSTTHYGVLKVHEYLADTLVALAGLHAAAALMHHWILGDGTLARMLPHKWSTPAVQDKARVTFTAPRNRRASVVDKSG